MILRSFYARISLLFLLLILILGAASLIIAFNASRHLFDEVEQLLNREYAASIAGELEPMVRESFSQDNIKNAIHYMMVLNPMVEIYLIDGRGNILGYFAGGSDEIKRTRINTLPLQQFADSGGYETVLGDDPRTENDRKPFSAARLQINNEEGWVYVILRGQSYDHSLAMLQANYYMRSGLITFIIAMAATLVVGLSLFFVLTNRLRKLSLGVHEFKSGRFDHRIEIRGRDEIAGLGNAFNEMAASIQDGMRKLHDAERQRGEMIANISHDLRSPLTSIRGHLETILLRENNLTAPERREFIDISIRNVQGLQRLVEELLDLAKLEARQISPARSTFSAAELVQDVVLKIKPESDQKNITIEYYPDPQLPAYTGDIGMIERVLTNILENAVEHTPESGHISISLVAGRANLIISVTDSGEGISVQDLPHIFERFYRADKSRTRKSRGTGLGLAIVKEVVELHGGSITAESPAGTGAVFRISLPLKV